MNPSPQVKPLEPAGCRIPGSPAVHATVGRAWGDGPDPDRLFLVTPACGEFYNPRSRFAVGVTAPVDCPDCLAVPADCKANPETENLPS